MCLGDSQQTIRWRVDPTNRSSDHRIPIEFVQVTIPEINFRVETSINQTFPSKLLADETRWKRSWEAISPPARDFTNFRHHSSPERISMEPKTNVRTNAF